MMYNHSHFIKLEHLYKIFKHFEEVLLDDLYEQFLTLDFTNVISQSYYQQQY